MDAKEQIGQYLFDNTVLKRECCDEIASGIAQLIKLVMPQSSEEAKKAAVMVLSSRLTFVQAGQMADVLASAGLLAVARPEPFDDERRRRIYYQNIVFDVCRQLDIANGKTLGHGSIVCGTAYVPTTQVQDALHALIAKNAQRKITDDDIRKKYIEMAHLDEDCGIVQNLIDLVQWAISASRPDYAAMEAERDKLEEALEISAGMYRTAEERTKKVEAERDRLQADLAEIRKVVEPIWDWYNDDACSDTPLPVIVDAAVQDLQKDRKEALRVPQLQAALAAANKRGDEAESTVRLLNSETSCFVTQLAAKDAEIGSLKQTIQGWQDTNEAWKKMASTATNVPVMRDAEIAALREQLENETPKIKRMDVMQALSNIGDALDMADIDRSKEYRALREYLIEVDKRQPSIEPLTPDSMPSDEEIDKAICSLWPDPFTTHKGKVQQVVRHFLQKYRGMVGPTAENILAEINEHLGEDALSDESERDILRWLKFQLTSRESVEKPLREQLAEASILLAKQKEEIVKLQAEPALTPEVTVKIHPDIQAEIARLKTRNANLAENHAKQRAELGQTIQRLERQFTAKNGRIAELERQLGRERASFAQERDRVASIAKICNASEPCDCPSCNPQPSSVEVTISNSPALGTVVERDGKYYVVDGNEWYEFNGKDVYTPYVLLSLCGTQEAYSQDGVQQGYVDWSLRARHWLPLPGKPEAVVAKEAEAWRWYISDCENIRRFSDTDTVGVCFGIYFGVSGRDEAYVENSTHWKPIAPAEAVRVLLARGQNPLATINQ